MSDLEDLFWNATIEEIKQGYLYEANLKAFVCLICGEVFEEGIIYPAQNKLLEASKAVVYHLNEKHSSVFEALINLDKKFSGMSEIQRELVEDFYKGLSDKEIAEKSGGSTSTIRNHRFKLREKEKQAKVFLALMNILNQTEPGDKRYMQIKNILTSAVTQNGGKMLKGTQNTKDDVNTVWQLPSKFNFVLITDIGSTTTKALLLEFKDGKWEFKAQSAVATTVEKPLEDVKIGIADAAREITRQCGVELLNEKNEIKIPYLTTSSAGGGLQIIVFGLTMTETGRLAQMAAYGAGAVILESFAIDDQLKEIHKMKVIRELHPDMILMAGGIDGGGIWGTLRQAQILALSDPEPKFVQSSKIPLIFAGNINARKYVSEILDDKFEISLTDNLRPNMAEINIEPTRQEIHRLFMESVMEKAPGYHQVKNWTIADILPTPAGVEKILELYCQKFEQHCLMVDIGGATTDIFSFLNGQYNRTVSANIGMSYSISNILKEAGINSIMKHLPVSYNAGQVRNYISNKMLNPTYVPKFQWERNVELATAAEGIALSFTQHKEMNYKVSRIGFLDKRRMRIFGGDLSPLEEIWDNAAEQSLAFQPSQINTIIAAGGVLSNSKNNEEVIFVLTEGFKPYGITLLSLDRPFKSPHLGVLSTIAKDEALELFLNNALEEIAYVVAPFGKIKAGKDVLKVKNLDNNQIQVLKGGEFLYLHKGGNLEIIPESGVSLDRKHEAQHFLNTTLPILFDCRGREDKFIDSSLGKYLLDKTNYQNSIYQSNVLIGRSEIISGEYIIDRRLAYKGEILVNIGQMVKPDTLIGHNLFSPPKLYLIDVKKLVGYEVGLTPKEITDGILIKVGDLVEKDQNIFKYSEKGKEHFYKSNVRGIVKKVEKSGFLILSENQDYDDKPVVVEVAKPLNIEPKKMEKYLKFSIGEYVDAGQIIAENVGNVQFDLNKKADNYKLTENYEDTTIRAGSTYLKIVKAPSTGIIREIDTVKGTVTIQYKSEPLIVKSFISGEIINTTDKISATIKGQGDLLYGIIGFCGEAIGRTEIVNRELGSSQNGKIVISFKPIDKKFLETAAQIGVTGIIAPSINNQDWVDYYGEEIGVALTGEEKIKFTLVLTEGFGEAEMNMNYQEFFRKNAGNTASICGRTQIRAGVTRPMIIMN